MAGEVHTEEAYTEEPYTEELVERFAQEAGIHKKAVLSIEEIDRRGAFIRQYNYFDTPFGEKEGQWKAEPGRYRIYWAKVCNWSCRPVIARDLLGLEDVISDIAVENTGANWVKARYGWGFPNQKDYKDPVTGAHFLAEFYKNADPAYVGRETTPSFVDVKTKKVVNNDYHRLSNYIEVFFYPWQTTDVDLYPVQYRKEIDELNDWLFPHVNNGHYRMAFAEEPEPYQEGYDDFFDSLEKLDKRLETNRFLFGDRITDSDIRLYVTLQRWEDWYVWDVGPLKKRITEYKNLWDYVKDLHEIPAFRKYTFFNIHTDGKHESGVRTYASRISPQIDWDYELRSDGRRKQLSRTPNDVFFHHHGEAPEEYVTEISQTPWNSRNPAERDNLNFWPEFDASVNPLKEVP